MYFILGNPGLQQGGGKENESEKNEEKKGEGEGKEKGEGKPWEASLHIVFLNQLIFWAVIGLILNLIKNVASEMGTHIDLKVFTDSKITGELAL